MSVREYIGARYIMKFSDPIAWDNTNVYEPLTVVQNSGASYISKQYVPDGVDILNTDYWIRMADFDAQIELYRQEVETYNDRITTNASDIDALEERLPKASFTSTNTVKKAIDDLSDLLPASSFTSTNTVAAAIASANSNISSLQTDVSNLSVATNKDYAVFIGDSYLRGTGSTDGPAGGEGYNSIGNGWGKTLINLEGLSASKVMCLGAGGAGFVGTGSNGGGVGLNYTGMIEKAASLMTSNEKSRVRYIIILGGANDGSDITSAGISNALDACRTNFPTVPVHVFTNLSTRSTSPKHDLSEGNAKAYNMIKNRCCNYGASFHETWILGLASTSIYADDNIHCSSAGYISLARAMHAAIHGGIITPPALKDYCGYFDITGETGVSVGSVKPYYDGNDTVTISATTLTVTTSTLPISGNSPITVATIPSGLAPRMTIQSVAVCYGSEWWPSGQFGLMPVDITNSGAIRVRRPYAVDATSASTSELITAKATLNVTDKNVLIMLPPITYKLY